MKNTIVIVGAASETGSAITRRLAGKDYRLLLVDIENEPLSKLVNAIKQINSEAEIELLECQTDACWEGDMIILALPYPEQIQVAEKIKQVATCKIVISTGNPLNDIQDLRKALPYSKLVIAFDKILPAGSDSYLTGEDEEAVEVVSQLMRDMELMPVVVTTGSYTSVKIDAA